MISEWMEALREGRNDPGIFKAIFTAGGPGSGKSFTAARLGLYAMGARPINSDAPFENALKKAGLSMKLDNLDPEVIDTMRVKAKKLSNAQMELAVNGRLGLVIDSTARDTSKIAKQKALLEALGYETAMVFVDTSLETALERNAQRPRSVPEKVVINSHKEIQKNKNKLKSMFGRNYWEIPNNGDIRDLEKATTAKFAKVSSWMKKLPNNKQVKDWMSKFEALEEAKQSPFEHKDFPQFAKMISGVAGTKNDPLNPQKTLEDAFTKIRKGRWTPKQWEIIHSMVAKLDTLGIKLKAIKGMYMGMKDGKGQSHESEELDERIDSRPVHKRNLQRIQDAMYKHEKNLIKKIQAKPAKARQELDIAIKMFKKNLAKATLIAQPVIQAQIAKYENILKMMKAQTESEEILAICEEMGLAQTDTNTKSIPKQPFVSKPDGMFAGNPVFDCDDETFSKCIKGKKKYGRWSTYLGKDNPFYGHIQNWMKQSYKHKNFILRNNKSGAMVYARSIMGEEKKIDEARQDWLALKNFIGSDSIKFSQMVMKRIGKMKRSRFKNVPNPGSHIKSIYMEDVMMSDPMNPLDYHVAMNFNIEWTGATSIIQKDTLAITREPDANNDKVAIYKILSKESRGTYRMKATDDPKMIISSLLERYYDSIILPKISADIKGFAAHYSEDLDESMIKKMNPSDKYSIGRNGRIAKINPKAAAKTVIKKSRYGPESVSKEEIQKILGVKKLSSWDFDNILDAMWELDDLTESLLEANFADLKQHKALQLYMNDPIYKAILQAKSPADLKKAMEAARKIRGNTALKNFQKAVKGII